MRTTEPGCEEPVDGDLVKQSLQTRDAFETLVRRHYRMVYAVAYAHLGQRETAEEAVQEAFLRAFLNLDQLKEPDSFPGWIGAIARNVARRWHAQGQTRSRLAAMVPLDAIGEGELSDTHSVSPRERLQDEQEASQVRGVISRLPAPQREVVLLHFLEGLSKSEIARQFGVHPSSIGRQLEKALRFLRQELRSPVDQVARSVEPRAQAVGRVVLLTAVTAALAPSAKAALAVAAGAEGIAVAAGSGFASGASSATQVVDFLHKLVSPATYGGEAAMIFKGLAITCALSAVIAGGLRQHSRPGSVLAEPVIEPPPEAVLIAQASPAPTRPAATVTPARNVTTPADTATTLPAFEILGMREAESAKVTCAAGNEPQGEPWASGGAIVPPAWGDAAGDSLEWSITLSNAATDLKLGVRYAYDERAHRTSGPPAVPHLLDLFIDDAGPVKVEVSDTGGWNHYKIATAELPFLQPGPHTMRLVSPAPRTCANVDCFTFYRGQPNSVSEGSLRPTEMAVSRSGRFIICATPNARVPENPQAIADTYDQLHDMMVAEYGAGPSGKICVHFADPDHWTETKCTAVKNQFGIYLLSDGKTTDRADWCWTLAEYFGDRDVPAWLRHSSARVSGLLDWLPALDNSTTTSEDVEGARLIEEARALLASPDSTCDRVEVVHAALRTRHGNDVFRKFWRLVAERKSAAKDQPLPPMDKNIVLELMSKAAGEDVTPLYRRWKGFPEAGPVDALVITDAKMRL
jgi:RNA polymerase sigma factor (sigma-70 family)